MTEKPFSVYTLSDPRTGDVRYIGISCDVEQRYKAHLSDTQNASKREWISELKISQLAPTLSIIETGLNVDSARVRELAWIRYYLENGTQLVNISGVTKPYTGGISATRKRKAALIPVPFRKHSRPLLTIAETAQRTGLEPSVVKKMLEHDEMPGYKIGGWRVNQDELDEFLIQTGM